jgi:DNA processing protein
MEPDSTSFHLLVFSLLPDVGPRRLGQLRARAPLASFLAHPGEASDLLGAAALASLRSGEAMRRASSEARRAAALGLRFVGLDDPDYPGLLRHAYDPPGVLYVRGDLASCCAPGTALVAMVGARSASGAGIALTRRLARELASAGVTVVSGLARGIDTAAHLGALEASGRTVAVQGRGMDGTYPPENATLAARIASDGGAVLSECPLGAGPAAENFPRRNRIIAALAQATIVVEAGRRSGALITARFAMEEGREVMAVPGHPLDERSFGPNALLRDGAALVRDATDVADELGLELSPPNGPGAVADPVLGALRPDLPLSLDDLAERSGQRLPALLARLSELEMAARVRRLPGPLFVRT